ncbi:MAG: helix-turn-helix domain-containing protein [Actinomycetota bacterium]|nr:helix-turn-helix domain-containing protein [Actinomycetota bacterium]
MTTDHLHEQANASEHSLADVRCLTVNQAAELLSLGRTKVYQLLDTGALQSIRIGAARRVPLWAVRQFVRTQLEAGTGDVTPVVHNAVGGGK